MSDTNNNVVLDYTSRDYDAIRTMLVGLARGKMPEWTTVGQAGDFGTLMLELMAYASDVTNYYVDRVGAEAFLGTAQRRQSVFYMADMLGYRPLSRRAATTVLKFSLKEGTDPATLPTLPEGTVRRYVDASGNVQAQVVAPGTKGVVVPSGTRVTTTSDDQSSVVSFETDTNVVLTGTDTYGTTTATEGTTVADELVGTSQGRAGAAYGLAQRNAIFQTLRVWTVEGGRIVPWTEVDAVANARPNQSAYSTYLDDSGYTGVVFGDNGAGRVAPAGAEIRASYRYGVGAAANSIATGALTNIDSSADWVPLVDATNTVSPVGGADPESLDAMRFAIPRAVRGRNRAVTLDDYVSMAVQVPGVAKAIAYGSVYSAVTLRVAPTGGFTSSHSPDDLDIDLLPDEPESMSNLRSAVGNYLRDRVLIGSKVFVERVQWHDVDAELDVYVRDGYRTDVVESGVRSAVEAVFAFDALDFGTKVTKGDVYRAALSVAGVDYVELTRLQPVVPSTLETGAQVENIVPGERRIAQLRRSELAEDFGAVVGLTLNVSGGLG